jgi:hypothetical protein
MKYGKYELERIGIFRSVFYDDNEPSLVSWMSN